MSAGSSSSSGTFAAVALGSNLGDRRGHIEWAAGRLHHHLTGLRLSALIETDPVGVDHAQPPYLNAVAVGHTTTAPGDLLDALLELERMRGRERLRPGAARTLDLDVILYGQLILDEPQLRLPHPRFRDRLFVLEPLAEVAPGAMDPVTGKSAAELLAALRGEERI